MYGIPGFELDDVPVIERVPLSDADALRIAHDTYGLDAVSAERLDTERDDSFALRTSDSGFVLKVAHPADPRDELDLQTQALEFARRQDPSLPLQRLVADARGDLMTRLPAHDGRIARLFAWLPGTLLLDAPITAGQAESIGQTLGQLSLALAEFDHPAASRVLAWDLAQFGRLRELSELFPVDAIRDAFDRFERNVAPLLHDLPQQVIHNDFNPGNILLDNGDHTTVTGILDFGDVVRTIRVADVAIALSYQLFPRARTWDEASKLVDGFERHVPLLSAEHDVLRDLVRCRFAQRFLINEWLDQANPEDERDDEYRVSLLVTLENMEED